MMARGTRVNGDPDDHRTNTAKDPSRLPRVRGTVLRLVGDAEADAQALLEHVGPVYVATLAITLAELSGVTR